MWSHVALAVACLVMQAILYVLVQRTLHTHADAKRLRKELEAHRAVMAELKRLCESAAATRVVPLTNLWQQTYSPRPNTGQDPSQEPET